ncbi:hypothetical protein RJ640_008774 [Escallonia rubra]|uniref:Uncharacterized protein n=1 Tax=Escallonia rubra TaxID=112253 RepID=A0AA88U9W4_9ASTE|nr:hypothetical protein RJ640_008774 [Escallonia rubra]
MKFASEMVKRDNIVRDINLDFTNLLMVCVNEETAGDSHPQYSVLQVHEGAAQYGRYINSESVGIAC